jgi:hypothetical protein
VRAAHFHVTRALIAALRPGNVLHLRRNRRASLSLSVLRAGRLVAAVGAVDDVPLGDAVAVRRARDHERESREKRSVMRAIHAGVARDPALLREYPAEVCVAGRWHECRWGATDLGPYAVHVVRGFSPAGLMDDMSVAVVHRDRCPVDAATASAQLLLLDGLVLDRRAIRRP